MTKKDFIKKFPEVKVQPFETFTILSKMDKMVKGAKLTDPNTNEEGTVTSDKPFLMGGEYCVNVDFPSDSGAYSCEYFID